VSNYQSITNLRLATRESPMALEQAHLVIKHIKRQFPDCEIQLVPMTTLGDDCLDKSIKDLDNKSVFVKTIESAILNNQADFAVHCVKDMSVYPVPGLMNTALLKRDDPRDALLSCKGHTLETLPQGALVGTGSPRRIAQLKSIRPDLKFTPIRGNVNTRIKKLEDGEVDALMLSYCGLLRIDKMDYVTQLFDPTDFISAVGQGTLCIQCRECDYDIQQFLHHLHDVPTGIAIAAEQALVHRLNGDCHTPIGVYARIEDGELSLDACIGDEKTGVVIYTKAQGSGDHAQRIGIAAADDLIAKGANHIVTPE
jgi:hydroxymethylbilane synthase